MALSSMVKKATRTRGVCTPGVVGITRMKKGIVGLRKRFSNPLVIGGARQHGWWRAVASLPEVYCEVE